MFFLRIKLNLYWMLQGQMISNIGIPDRRTLLYSSSWTRDLFHHGPEIWILLVIQAILVIQVMQVVHVMQVLQEMQIMYTTAVKAFTLPPDRTQPQKLCTANFSSGTFKTLINRLLRLKNKIFWRDPGEKMPFFVNFAHIWAYLQIWGHNFAMDSPNDLIFWFRS